MSGLTRNQIHDAETSRPMHNQCCYWYVAQKTNTTSWPPAWPTSTVVPVLTVPEINRLYKPVCTLARCSGLQLWRWEILRYGGTLFSRLCYTTLRSFAVLRTPSQLRGPDSACSELFRCVIQRLLSLITQDRTGTLPLPQAATVYMQLPKHAPQNVRVPLTFLSHHSWCQDEQKTIHSLWPQYAGKLQVNVKLDQEFNPWYSSAGFQARPDIMLWPERSCIISFKEDHDKRSPILLLQTVAKPH